MTKEQRAFIIWAIIGAVLLAFIIVINVQACGGQPCPTPVATQPPPEETEVPPPQETQPPAETQPPVETELPPVITESPPIGQPTVVLPRPKRTFIPKQVTTPISDPPPSQREKTPRATLPPTGIAEDITQSPWGVALIGIFLALVAFLAHLIRTRRQ